MNLQATKEIRVFIDKKYYNQEFTQVDSVPKNRRENISWKGCYYTIQKGEKFTFDRSNDWDRCYFKLINDVEFIIGCGNPKTFINKQKVIIL